MSRMIKVGCSRWISAKADGPSAAVQHVVAVLLQIAFDDAPNLGVVFDNHDQRRHGNVLISGRRPSLLMWIGSRRDHPVVYFMVIADGHGPDIAQAADFLDLIWIFGLNGER